MSCSDLKIGWKALEGKGKGNLEGLVEVKQYIVCDFGEKKHGAIIGS